MLLIDEIFRKAHPEIILSGDYSWFIIKKELREDVPLKILFTDTNSLHSIFLRFQYFSFPFLQYSYNNSFYFLFLLHSKSVLSSSPTN